MRNKVLLPILSCILTVSLVIPAFAEPTIDSVKKQREKTQGGLNQISKQIEGLEGNKAEVEEEITEMNTELVDILTSIGVCQNEIEIKEKEIDDATVKLEQAEMDESRQYESMKRRVQFLYEKGDKAYVQALIESTGYSDLVNKADYVEKLYSYDHELLEQYIGVKQEVEELKELLEEEEAALESSRFELGQEQATLETLISEKKKTVEDFDQQLALAREAASNMQKQLENQTLQLRALEEAKRKEKEAALKKQQEEAAKKAKLLKKKSNTDASDNGEVSINVETGETEGGSDDGDDDYTTTNEEFSAGAGAATVESSGSSAGQKVIDYACQFVGNPYVYGGTSLTNGTDCSGFTQSVYKHFGISLPRDSFSQRSCGVGVSYDEAQPGDIVCYAGHVALYMGGGMIVHASTERTGITYSPATYRTIITIRRVL
ncbi:MAG: C40 family peptidase [Lachnospiraceae bacterium]|nr:C40 family peptidase [Lachnospiraceae bacterium]